MHAIRRHLAGILLILLVGVLPSTSSAQQPDSLRRVVLTDGTVLVGTVADENADPIVIMTRDGVEQRVPRSRVKEITALIRGKFHRVDPTRTRLAFAPTGRTLGNKGDFRIGTSLYIFPSVTYAVGDRVDVTGAAFYVFGDGGVGILIGGAKGQLLESESADVAIGITVVAPTASSVDFNGAIAGLPYVATSIGSDVASLNLALSGVFGGSLGSGDFETADGAVLSIGGEYQISNSFKLLAESYLPIWQGAGGAGLIVPGIRFFGDKFSVDLYGVIGFDNGSSGAFAPLANFALRL